MNSAFYEFINNIPHSQNIPMRITNWHVITGAPCSGKSAVIGRLEQLGYRVVHEVARAIIDEELQKGKTIVQIKADILSFERRILDAKLSIEKSLPDDGLTFFDRGVPDSIAYYILEGLSPDYPAQKSRLTRYSKIFFFERLRFEKDRVRSEDDGIAATLEHLLKESYQMLGYTVLRVPLMPVEKRVEYILNRL